jgi:hypothetical protein
MKTRSEVAILVYENGVPKSALRRFETYGRDIKLVIEEASKARASFRKIYEKDDIKVVTIERDRIWDGEAVLTGEPIITIHS